MKSFLSAVKSLLSGLADATLLTPKGEWIPEDHLPRLAQYDLFRRLDEGQFAELIRDPAEKAKFREYGDIGLIVDTSRDAVLGDDFGIEVPGAEDEDNSGARARLTLLESWAERERYASKLYQGESDAALVGDSVYELRADGERLHLKVHEPEAFFPVWDSVDGDFSEAFIAWEEPNNGQWPGAPDMPVRDLRNKYGDVVLFRRHYRKVDPVDFPLVDAVGRDKLAIVTGGWYRIDDLRERASRLDQFTLIAAELDSDGNPLVDADTGFDEIPLFYVPNIETTRQPWGLPEAHRVAKILIDASLDQSDMRENTRYSAFPLVYDKAEKAQGRIAPGTPEPSARSAEPYKPGMIYNGRDLGMIDFSNGNKVLIEHERFLIEKALSNSRTTTIAAGLVNTPGEIPSGLALTIALLPLIQKTMPKRQTRRDKLGMMLKHVLRWHRANGSPGQFFRVVETIEEAGEGPDAATRRVERETAEAARDWPTGIWDDVVAYPTFGTILPIDKKATSEIVRDLMNAGAISQELATMILQAAGFPIEDAAEEVERIREASRPPPGLPGSGFGREGTPIPGLDGRTEPEEA